MNPSSRISGRPRSDASKEAILVAAYGLLQEKGYEGLAIEPVAKRAGVGKTTIYRWWRNRQELAVEAFFHSTQTELGFPETGSAREDFRCQIQQLGDMLRGSTGVAMGAMIAASRTDDVLRQALAERWINPRRQWGQARMLRAVAQHECVPGLQVDMALELLYSPIYARLLFGRGIPNPAEIDELFRMAALGIFVEPTSSS